MKTFAEKTKRNSRPVNNQWFNLYCDIIRSIILFTISTYSHINYEGDWDWNNLVAEISRVALSVSDCHSVCFTFVLQWNVLGRHLTYFYCNWGSIRGQSMARHPNSNALYDNVYPRQLPVKLGTWFQRNSSRSTYRNNSYSSRCLHSMLYQHIVFFLGDRTDAVCGWTTLHTQCSGQNRYFLV